MREKKGEKPIMITLNLEEREARIIFAALNGYRITRALTLINEEISAPITNDDTLKEIDRLIEGLYYKINSYEKIPE